MNRFKYKHENYLVMKVVMHYEYFPVHQHINDRICDNFAHLLIEDIYEIFQVNNEKYNHRQHDTNQKDF
jgi:hypothetical protein